MYEIENIIKDHA